jgi:hypothetical protein
MKNVTPYDFGNPGPDLRQAQQCGGYHVPNIYNILVSSVSLAIYGLFL